MEFVTSEREKPIEENGVSLRGFEFTFALFFYVPFMSLGLLVIMCAVVFPAFVGWSPVIIHSSFVCAGKLNVVSLRPHEYDALAVSAVRGEIAIVPVPSSRLPRRSRVVPCITAETGASPGHICCAETCLCSSSAGSGQSIGCEQRPMVSLRQALCVLQKPFLYEMSALEALVVFLDCRILYSVR